MDGNVRFRADMRDFHHYFFKEYRNSFCQHVARRSARRRLIRISASYILRYAVITIVFAVICITGFFNPVLVFIGYMSLKAGALLQPQTHKLCNRIFHETDPVPMSEEELKALEGEINLK